MAKSRKPKKRIFYSAFFVTGIVILCLYAGKQYLNWRNARSAQTVDCPRCHILFPDNVATQKRAYRDEGIEEQEKFADLYALEQRGVMQRIKSNDLFNVSDLTHSVPLLLPKGLDFLETLGRRYSQQCESKNISYKKFEVISLTRSKESIRDLRKSNPISIRESSHLKGKTLDISYRAFAGYQDQLNAFITTLSELRKEGRCYVKFERKGSLHITVR